jgi:glycosyltransferase involved in cell wall biosynthesis
MDSPLFSIIIPTYNHAHLIKKCLQSLIDQQFQDWEAIVVNNFSADNTLEVVESFEDNRIQIINFNNKGVIAASRNEGIRNAKGEWIAFLDSDDWWYPNKLSKITQLFNKSDIIFHNLDVNMPKGKTRKTLKGRKLREPVFEDLLTKGNQILNSSVVIRKNLIEQEGYLNEDPNLFAIEDYDLWLRIAKITSRFNFINEALGAYWVSNYNYSIANRKSIERMKHLYKIHLPAISDNKKHQAMALLNYIVTRERMLCGDRFLLFNFLRTVFHLKRTKFIINSIIFGILSIFKSKTGVKSQ